MKIFNNKIFNKVAISLLVVVLLFMNVLNVKAYTADASITGYPFVLDNLFIRLFGYPNGSFEELEFEYGTLEEQNIYYFECNDVSVGVEQIRIGNSDILTDMIFPYDPYIFDYYIVGTFGYEKNNSNHLELPDSIQVRYYDSNGGYQKSNLNDVNIYDFNTALLSGFSFSGALNSSTSHFDTIAFNFDSDDNQLKGDVYFCASVIPVAKGNDDSSLLNSILSVLNQINQNIISGNNLQQSTIDAIIQHDANEKSWFQQLIHSMGIGFSALYEQMTKEQDEQLYGYDDSTTADANTQFSSESDRLTSLEGELSDSSHQYVSDYTAEGFDLAILSTLGNSLLFVTTWFTNFWNIGGVFTAVLNFCLCISIVAFILRFRS